MLAKNQRFHGHTAVRQAYRQGVTIRGGACSLHVVRGRRINTTKVAVVVSKKVHKSAVLRNRIRRRIYEVVRMYLPGVQEPVELVVTVYAPETAFISSEELNEQIQSLLRRAKL